MELTNEEAFLHLATWMRAQRTVCLLYKTPDGAVDASTDCTISAADSGGFSVQLQGDAGTLSFQTREACGATWRYGMFRCPNAMSTFAAKRSTNLRSLAASGLQGAL